jgi:diguanylate cyclase (GGDEF)-like protein/PAS domain S-box-containing protein
MQFSFPGFTILYAISTVLCIMSAEMAWRRRNNPGSTPFALLMLALAIWSFASIFEAGAITVPNKLFWSKWQYLGITNVAPLWLLFTAEYTGRKISLSKNVRRLLWVIPITTLFLAFTNEFHNLIWSEIRIVPGTINTGIYERGIGFYVHTAFSYVCLMFGTFWLIKDTLTSEKNRKFQSILFIFGVIISWAANSLYVLQLLPIIKFDITPLSISFIALLMAWNIFRYRIFDLSLIAREKLLTSMKEGVIVIDPNDIIIEINTAALKIIGYKGKQPVGRSVWDAFKNYTPLFEKYRNIADFKTEIEVPGNQYRVVELQVSLIDTAGKNTSGQMIMLRDITQRKQSEGIETDQRKFSEALANTAAIINSSLELNDVLDKILENVAKVVPQDGATVVLVDDLGKATFAGVKSGKNYERMKAILSLNLDVMEFNSFKKMEKTREVLIISDTHSHADWSDSIKESKWIRSYLGVPIIGQDVLLGFINLESGMRDFFKPEHGQRMEIFANYAATALMNAKLYSEVRFYADEMAIFYEISQTVASGEGLERTTLEVFEQLKKVIPIDLFFLALYEPTEKILSYYMYQKDGERIEIKPFKITEKPSLARFMMEKKKTVYIPDFKADDVELKEDQVIQLAGVDNRTILGIPLIHRGGALGVLSVQAADPNAYSESQVKLVETIAHQTGIAMDNAKLFEKMQQMAITDGLTGLYNRHYFNLILTNEVERAKRYESPLSLVMLDIDHFKVVNDTYGHLAGDELLQEFSKVCRKPLRQTDTMFRYGGEEFVLLLPETKLDEALAVAERVRAKIEGTTFVTHKGDIHITVSAGVSEFGPQTSSLNAFIESTDTALYAAKEAGRNCIREYSQE